MADSCFHFTGIQNTSCKAGVDYCSFPLGTLPCLGDRIGKGPKSHCDSFRLPTPEEKEAEVAACELSFSRTYAALEACRKDAKERGIRKGNGGGATIDCPVCSMTASLSYSVAGSNGHMHGRCSTAKCVWWMQ